jgi:beta-N-acetylhexosaminidase
LLIPVAAGVAAWVALADGTARAPRDVVAVAVRDLPARRLAGQRLVAGFDGPRAPRAIERMIRQGRLAGVILFSDNLGTRRHARRTIRRLQHIRRPEGLRDPLLVMVDQEGGLVKRVSGAPTASARQMGARGAAFSAQQGRATAANLRELGINVDFAPVLDVGRPGGVIAETDRSFGATAAKVEATAIPFAKALQAGGVAATGKHFPGFGAATENTDFSVERIDLSKGELRAVDEKPYAAFAAAGGKLVMLSTAIYPAFSDRPAAFTRAIATGELRNRLGFEGVSVTDALETPAVDDFGGTAKVAVAGARAGADLLLFARLGPAEQAWKALVVKLRSHGLDRGEFEAAAQRVLDLRAGLGR